MLQATNGAIPMWWWGGEKNFGDVVGPWLTTKMTGKAVIRQQRTKTHYVTVGSIIAKVRSSSVVWGTGSGGDETKELLCPEPRYLAVRGPLTRNKLETHGISCPAIYGDPALLAPDYYKPIIEPRHELGIVLRWSEFRRKKMLTERGFKVIDLLSEDVEGVIDDMLSCKKILTTSLHGLIFADAYNIPNAWLIADTGKGKEFKFWDYLITVEKVRSPHRLDLAGVSERWLLDNLRYDDRRISLDLDPLRANCPFLHRNAAIEAAEKTAMAGARVFRARRKLRAASLAAAAV